MNHLPRLSTTSPATTTRVSPPPPIHPPPAPLPPPPPSPVPPPTPSPLPNPPPALSYPDMRAETQVCESPEILPAAWISDRGALIIAITILIAITVEISAKFYFLKRRKKELDDYLEEKLEDLELEQEKVFWQYLKNKLQ